MDSVLMMGTTRSRLKLYHVLSLFTVFFSLKKRSDPPTEQSLDNGTSTKDNKLEKTLMDKKNLMPQAAQPVNRTTTGQLPAELAELSEAAMQLHHGDLALAFSASAKPGGGGFRGTKF
jgi:bacteriocin leader peptide (microcyclamide/patellamide family)